MKVQMSMPAKKADYRKGPDQTLCEVIVNKHLSCQSSGQSISFLFGTALLLVHAEKSKSLLTLVSFSNDQSTRTEFRISNGQPPPALLASRLQSKSPQSPANAIISTR